MSTPDPSDDEMGRYLAASAEVLGSDVTAKSLQFLQDVAIQEDPLPDWVYDIDEGDEE